MFSSCLGVDILSCFGEVESTFSCVPRVVLNRLLGDGDCYGVAVFWVFLFPVGRVVPFFVLDVF